jgi:hypothetical protein
VKTGIHKAETARAAADRRRACAGILSQAIELTLEFESSNCQSDIRAREFE